jgi:two-component system, LuxR family, response regulator FixJ
MPLVFVVDDMSAVAAVTAERLAATGELICRWFTDPLDLLLELRPGMLDCLVADLAMPTMNGAELQERVIEIDPCVSVVFVTGRADITTTVRVMERGAITLLEKPCCGDRIVQAVREGVERTQARRALVKQRHDAESALRELTSDEQAVLECMVRGWPNKTIARELSLSARTVDRRRHDVLQKCGVSSVAELAVLVACVERQVHDGSILKSVKP